MRASLLFWPPFHPVPFNNAPTSRAQVKRVPVVARVGRFGIVPLTFNTVAFRVNIAAPSALNILGVHLSGHYVRVPSDQWSILKAISSISATDCFVIPII